MAINVVLNQFQKIGRCCFQEPGRQRNHFSSFVEFFDLPITESCSRGTVGWRFFHRSKHVVTTKHHRILTPFLRPNIVTKLQHYISWMGCVFHSLLELMAYMAKKTEGEKNMEKTKGQKKMKQTEWPQEARVEVVSNGNHIHKPRSLQA